jgi:BarA-like signal transduction histidine kinase
VGPIVVALVVLVSVITVAGYAAFARFLEHRERMAALESKRPRVILALPAGDQRDADQLTAEILEACKDKGIDVDVDMERLALAPKSED